MAIVVAHKIERILPDSVIRHRLLGIFAESMRYIERRRHEWRLVRLNGNHLRLFAGRLIVLTIESETAWVTTDSFVPPTDFAPLPSWRWDEKSYPKYARTPSRNGYYTPRADSGNDWSTIRLAHLAYLERVLATGAAPDVRTVAKHESAAVNYIENVVPKDQAELPGFADFDAGNVFDTRVHAPALITRRQGQRAFRDVLLQAYGSACAFSGCGVEQVLDAAHIIPYRGSQTNHVQNGLLLRTDLHTLFDLGLITIDSATMTILVSNTIAEATYLKLGGESVRVPRDPKQCPSTDALNDHRERSNLALHRLDGHENRQLLTRAPTDEASWRR